MWCSRRFFRTTSMEQDFPIWPLSFSAFPHLLSMSRNKKRFRNFHLTNEQIDMRINAIIIKMEDRLVNGRKEEMGMGKFVRFFHLSHNSFFRNISSDITSSSSCLSLFRFRIEKRRQRQRRWWWERKQIFYWCTFHCHIFCAFKAFASATTRNFLFFSSPFSPNALSIAFLHETIINEGSSKCEAHVLACARNNSLCHYLH